MINIKCLDKAEVLCKLYNNARCVGLGFLQHKPGDLDIKEARKVLKEYTYFDYFNGRVMKVDLSGDEFNEDLYDRDNGKGAAYMAIFGKETPK